MPGDFVLRRTGPGARRRNGRGLAIISSTQWIAGHGILLQNEPPGLQHSKFHHQRLEVTIGGSFRGVTSLPRKIEELRRNKS